MASKKLSTRKKIAKVKKAAKKITKKAVKRAAKKSIKKRPVAKKLSTNKKERNPFAKRKENLPLKNRLKKKATL